MLKEAEDIAARILSLNLDRPTRVSVDGFCGAGKTTFADQLAEELLRSGRPVIRACTDNFQSPPEIRWQLGQNSPEGFYRHSFDFRSIRKHLLEPLGGPGGFSYRTSTYDIRRMEPNVSPLFVAESDSILILDGLFLFLPEMYSFWDFAVFVDAPFELCIARAKRRNQEMLKDAEAVEKRYRERFVPGFQMYLKQCDPKSLADVVVESDGNAFP